MFSPMPKGYLNFVGPSLLVLEQDEFSILIKLKPTYRRILLYLGLIVNRRLVLLVVVIIQLACVYIHNKKIGIYIYTHIQEEHRMLILYNLLP